MDVLIRKGSKQIIFTKIYSVSIKRRIIKDASKDKPKNEDTILAFYEVSSIY